MASDKKPKSIDEYIAEFSPDIQEILQKIRATIANAAPDAQEAISYRMPAFRQGAILAYFAAWKNHIGFYPPVSGNEKLKKEVEPYEGEKGNLQFPLNKPIPYDLIERIIKYRVSKLNQE
jgi:uncharacterized protein YdhG (YjbR/CyaY superfamily)